MFDDISNPFETARLILDRLPVGLLFCDRRETVRYINKTYADLLGLSMEDALGRRITELIPHSRAREVMASGMPEIGDLCHLGLEKPVVVNRIPVRDDADAIIGMISQSIFREPDDLHRLSERIQSLGAHLTRLRRRIQASFAPQYSFDDIIGASEALASLKRQASRYSQVNEPVLILGPTGVGKELFAHAIHAASPRSEKPLVCVNCASIPRDLFESELFGYERGAFSGARDGKIGLIELADGGSLFLDEIGELPLEIQAKLLRVTETRGVRRLGALRTKKIDFRLLAATNRNLAAMLKNGSFRDDLYYRLNTFVLAIPPLCERKGDILPIARSILASLGLGFLEFAPQTEAALLNRIWPGNVRELRNAVVHAATLRKGDKLFPEDFPPEFSRDDASGAETLSGLAESRQNAEASAIRDALLECGGNVAATARKLQISRATLYEKMRRCGVNPRRL